MNRIFVNLSIDQLRSDSRCRSYMYYLQIRAKTKTHAGWFTPEFFSESLGVSIRSTKKIIELLLKDGFIVKPNEGAYRIVGQKTIAEVSNKARCYMISDEELFSYSWRNISAFRSLILEITGRRYKAHQRHKAKGIKVIDPRSKAVDIIKNPSLKAWDNLFALNLAAALGNVTYETARRWRKRQNCADYTWAGFTKHLRPDSLDLDTEGKEIFLNPGDFQLSSTNCVLISPCSKRIEKLSFKYSFKWH